MNDAVQSRVQLRQNVTTAKLPARPLTLRQQVAGQFSVSNREFSFEFFFGQARSVRKHKGSLDARKFLLMHRVRSFISQSSCLDVFLTDGIVFDCYISVIN